MTTTMPTLPPPFLDYSGLCYNSEDELLRHQSSQQLSSPQRPLRLPPLQHSPQQPSSPQHRFKLLPLQHSLPQTSSPQQHFKLTPMHLQASAAFFPLSSLSSSSYQVPFRPPAVSNRRQIFPDPPTTPPNPRRASTVPTTPITPPASSPPPMRHPSDPMPRISGGVEEPASFGDTLGPFYLPTTTPISPPASASGLMDAGFDFTPRQETTATTAPTTFGLLMPIDSSSIDNYNNNKNNNNNNEEEESSSTPEMTDRKSGAVKTVRRALIDAKREKGEEMEEKPTILRCKRRVPSDVGSHPSSSTSPGRHSATAARPAVSRRNERERNRVKLVNLGFTTLRERVPHIGRAGKKMSKVDTLRCAVEYIQRLKEIIADHDRVFGAPEEAERVDASSEAADPDVDEIPTQASSPVSTTPHSFYLPPLAEGLSMAPENGAVAVMETPMASTESTTVSTSPSQLSSTASDLEENSLQLEDNEMEEMAPWQNGNMEELLDFTSWFQ